MCVRRDHSWQSSKFFFHKEAFVCLLPNSNQGNEDTAIIFLRYLGCLLQRNTFTAPCILRIIYFKDKPPPPSWTPFLHLPFTLRRILSKAISWIWPKYKYAKLCHCSVFLKYFFPPCSPLFNADLFDPVPLALWYTAHTFSVLQLFLCI